MQFVATPASRSELARALQLMTEAIDILDQLNAPGEIGSMLDLSIARLEKILARGEQPAFDGLTLLTHLEPELNAVPARDYSRPDPWKMSRD